VWLSEESKRVQSTQKFVQSGGGARRIWFRKGCREGTVHSLPEGDGEKKEGGGHYGEYTYVRDMVNMRRRR
jgi:hypothetical protein